ncbi:MAG: hypothetical protein ABIT76_13915 [Chthoniobacterales bacterium]
MVSSELSDHKPGVLTAFRVLFAFASAAVIVALILYATRGTTTYDPARATKRYENLKKLNDENAKKIGEYGVVDKAKGIYQLPLKAAITLTARDLAKIQPHSAYPVATTPAPAAAAAPAAPVPAATPAAQP